MYIGDTFLSIKRTPPTEATMKLSTITDAYEYEIDCLVCDCKTTGELETLKIIEAQYLGERELFDRIIKNSIWRCGSY